MVVQAQIRRHCLVLAVVVCALSGCGLVVDLDVTLFTRLDLEEALNEQFDPATAGMEGENVVFSGSLVPIVYRTDVDLTEDIGDELGDGVVDIVLERISYRLPDNTMTADLYDIEVFVAAADASIPEEGVRLGLINRIPAMTAVDTTPLDTELVAEQVFEERMKALMFTVFIKAFVKVPASSEAQPEGNALIELDVQAKLHH